MDPGLQGDRKAVKERPMKASGWGKMQEEVGLGKDAGSAMPQEFEGLARGSSKVGREGAS